MNRFKQLIESDLHPADPVLTESKKISVKVKIPISNYAKKGDLASTYAKRDTSAAEKLASKQFKKKFKSFEISEVEFTKLTKSDAIFIVTAEGE